VVGLRVSHRLRRWEREGTNVDEVNVRHLLDERWQHFVNELRIRQDDLLDPSRPHEMLDVTREVVRAKEGGEDVDVVGELEDFGAEFDSLGRLEKGAKDGDAIASGGVELDHVECAC
jgi:hypothetical protein